MISRFYPDWKEVMFGRDRGGLNDDIEILKNEASEVLHAIEKLDQEIFDGISEHRLKNGSHVKTKVFNALNANQKQRVLAHFDGRFYEHKGSHHQYKVHIDSKDGRLAIVSEPMSSDKEHFCIIRPEQ